MQLYKGMTSQDHDFQEVVPTLPLRGMFNLLVFVRPSVAILRRGTASVKPSWFKVFAQVVKASGKIPSHYNALLQRANRNMGCPNYPVGHLIKPDSQLHVENSVDLKVGTGTGDRPGLSNYDKLSALDVATPEFSWGLDLSANVAQCDDVCISAPGKGRFYNSTKRDYPLIIGR